MMGFVFMPKRWVGQSQSDEPKLGIAQSAIPPSAVASSCSRSSPERMGMASVASAQALK